MAMTNGTNPSFAFGKARWLPAALFALAAIVSLVLLVRGLWTGSSFWLDELYSVTAVESSLAETLRIAFHDVHPPLYYLTLHTWGLLFGLSEVATRSLSALFALGAVASLLLLRDRLPRETLAVVAALMLANPWLQVYAQEARANSMLMALATLGFAAAASGRWRLVPVAALLMGLTHYFGTIVAGLLLIWMWRANRERPVLAAAGGAVLVLVSAWPLAQILFGRSRDLMGGRFWIDGGPGMVLVDAFEVGLPQIVDLILRFERLSGLGLPIAAAVVIFALVPLAVPVLWRAGRDLRVQRAEPVARLALQALALIAGIMAAVALIGLHTPITLSRNFIVVVPLAAIVLAWLHGWAAAGGRPRLADTVLAVFVLIGLASANDRLSYRQAPMQDWQGTAEAALARLEAQPMPLYHLAHGRFFPEWTDRVYNHYLASRAHSYALPLQDAATTAGPYLILFGHQRCTPEGETRLSQTLRLAGVSFETVLPVQSSWCSTGYLLVDPAAGVTTD